MKRWWTVLLAAGIALPAVHAYAARIASGEAAVFALLPAYGAAFLVYLAGAGAARKLHANRPGLVLLWVAATAAASMAAYAGSSLPLSREVDRFRWDGRVAAAGYNPYLVAPDDPELAGLRAAFPDSIPDPGAKGLYPPLAEELFYMMARTGFDARADYRLLLSLAALAAGLALAGLCRAVRVPVVSVAFFLWHPLLILETAGSAHLDALGVLLVTVSLALLETGHELNPLNTLALATLARGIPIALLPLYLRRIPAYRVLLYFLVLGAGALPFLAAGSHLFRGLAAYLAHARFNPGPYLLIEKLFQAAGRPEWTRVAVAALGLGVAAVLYLTDDGTGRSIIRRAFYLALPPVLLGPVVNPWYLVWLLPFLAVLPEHDPLRMPLLFLSGSVVLAYVALPWGFIPGWVSWLEYGPVALGAAWALWRRRRMRRVPAVA